MNPFGTREQNNKVRTKESLPPIQQRAQEKKKESFRGMLTLNQSPNLRPSHSHHDHGSILLEL